MAAYMREKSMRRLTCAFVLVSLGLGAFACSDDGGGGTLAANARWRLRCPVDGAGCFDADRDPHVISAKEGDADAIVACGFVDFATNQRALSMEFADATARLQIDDVVINNVGGVVATDGCQVTIVDDGVTFGPHHCGPEAPSPTQPCQITTVGLQSSGSLVLDDGTISGTLVSTTVRCTDIADQAVTEVRQLVSPDSPPPNLMAVPISVVNCDNF